MADAAIRGGTVLALCIHRMTSRAGHDGMLLVRRMSRHVAVELRVGSRFLSELEESRG